MKRTKKYESNNNNGHGYDCSSSRSAYALRKRECTTKLLTFGRMEECRTTEYAVEIDTKNFSMQRNERQSQKEIHFFFSSVRSFHSLLLNFSFVRSHLVFSMFSFIFCVWHWFCFVVVFSLFLSGFFFSWALFPFSNVFVDFFSRIVFLLTACLLSNTRELLCFHSFGHIAHFYAIFTYADYFCEIEAI